MHLSDSEKPRFTVLLPVHRPPSLLPYAIETVLGQTNTNFELFIVCDGAPDETITCARTYAGRDSRVKVFPFPKGQGCGEAHRHTALQQATGIYVAHIADDDLWFPNHLEEMGKLLNKVDFGHLMHVYAYPDGSLQVLASDLSSPEFRERILTEIFNTLGDTVTGYRLAAYRRLPEGWAPPPEMAWPDLKMWRKFLRREDLTFGTRAAVTALVFQDYYHRPGMTLEDRRLEVQRWYEDLRDPVRCAEIVQEAWRSLVNDAVRKDRTIRLTENQLGQVRNWVALGGITPEKISELVDRRLQIGQAISFSEGGNSALYTLSGWSYQERGFRWTEGQEATLRVRLDVPEGKQKDRVAIMRIRAVAFGQPQRVVVRVHGVPAQQHLVAAAEWREYDVRLPNEAHEMEIGFQVPDSHSPYSVGVNPDRRELGIAVSSIVCHAPQSDPPDDGTFP